MSKNHAAEFPLSKNPEIAGNSSEFTVQGSLKKCTPKWKGMHIPKAIIYKHVMYSRAQLFKGRLALTQG